MEWRAYVLDGYNDFTSSVVLDIQHINHIPNLNTPENFIEKIKLIF